MLVASLACRPLFLSGGRLVRMEALLLFAGYVLYIGWCITASVSELSRTLIICLAFSYGLVFIVATAGPLIIAKKRTDKEVSV